MNQAITMGRILCFGELLLRLSPLPDGEWLDKNTMAVYLGGAELNVATALARWDLPVAYCTALPDHYLSADVVKKLGERKINTEAIHYSGNRIGTYFLPQGKDLKHSGVIYDRAHSSFASLETGVLDWDTILQDVSWLHFSAISPALNDHAAAVCREGLRAASKKNITISVDLNHRPALWKERKHPHEVMPELVQYCHVVMGNIWSARELLGIPLTVDVHEKETRSSYLDHAKESSMAVMKQFQKCTAVANTFRFDLADRSIQYYASLWKENKQYASKEFISKNIVDKVGTGDCFMAGLIFGSHKGYAAQKIIDFATAAAFGKFHETGDATSQDLESIMARINQYE